MIISNDMITQIARDMQEGKEIDLRKYYNEVVNDKSYKHLDKKYGEKKIYILTLMVCTRMSEKEFVQLTDNFAKTIPSKDWSKNVMQCIPDKIDWSLENEENKQDGNV